MSKVAILGYTDGYDYAARKAAMRELLDLQKKGLPYESLSAVSKKALSAPNSFASPTWAMMDALGDRGIEVVPYNLPSIADLSPSERMAFIDRIAKDKGIASVLQVGNLPNQTEALNRLSASGKHLGRLATDFGDGGFLQPKYHLAGFGDTGSVNGMYIDPSVKYNSIYLPGGNLSKWNIPEWARGKTVSTGRLATAPIFDTIHFNKIGDKARAILVTGGGSGLGMPFEKELSGSLGAASRSTLLNSEENIYDHMLKALRKKHGTNFTLDHLAALADDPGLNSRAHAPEVLRLATHKGTLPDVGVIQDVNRLRYLLDPSSELSKGVEALPGGREFLQNIRTRYSGLNLMSRIPQSDMTKMYAGADYIFDLPGSSVGEIMRMKGNEHGGMIHLIPQQNALYPRHFMSNAIATNAIMQPGAKNNIIDITSPTLGADIDKAVAEGGFKNWGRKPIMSSEEAMRPLVDDVAGYVKRHSDDMRALGVKENIAKLFKGSKSVKAKALSNIFSLNGLKDMNLALGGVMTKNPLLRRLALPSIITAAGLGTGLTLLNNKKKSSLKDKMLSFINK